MKHGVLQGSLLNPLVKPCVKLYVKPCFLYVNDLQNAVIYYTAFMLADDMSMLHADKSPKSLRKQVNIDLKLLVPWLNILKSEVNLFRQQKKN